MLGKTEHQIKRAWRFCANKRVEPTQAMHGVVARLLKGRKKKLLIAVDRVDVKGFQTLLASVVLKGRSVPIAWASTTSHVYDGHKSRNAFEESLLLARQQFKPSEWCSSTRQIECGVFTIGLIMLAKVKASPPAAFRAVKEMSESLTPKWG